MSAGGARSVPPKRRRLTAPERWARADFGGVGAQSLMALERGDGGKLGQPPALVPKRWSRRSAVSGNGPGWPDAAASRVSLSGAVEVAAHYADAMARRPDPARNRREGDSHALPNADQQGSSDNRSASRRPPDDRPNNGETFGKQRHARPSHVAGFRIAVQQDHGPLPCPPTR